MLSQSTALSGRSAGAVPTSGLGCLEGWNSTAQHSGAQHGAVWHGTTQQCIAIAGRGMVPTHYPHITHPSARITCSTAQYYCTSVAWRAESGMQHAAMCQSVHQMACSRQRRQRLCWCCLCRVVHVRSAMMLAPTYLVHSQPPLGPYSPPTQPPLLPHHPCL